MENPLISIIVRTKDRPGLLKDALRSIASQNYRPIEVVLVNDGGGDLDLDEIKGILGDVSLNYIRLRENRGRPHAGNAGIENAKGEYIGFLDDDDLFRENHIRTLYELCAGEGAKVAYSSVQAAYYEWGEGGAGCVKSGDSHLYAGGFSPSRLLFENYIPLNGLLFSRDVLLENRFDENLRFNEDWDLLIRLSRKYGFVHSPDVSAEYRLFPKDGPEDRKEIHPEWLKLVFDKHRHLITGSDWDAFYNKYLMPKHSEDLKFLRSLVSSEQARLEKEIRERDIFISRKDGELRHKEAIIHHRDEDIRHKDEEMAKILSSESWKLTYPLRVIGRLMRFFIKAVKYAVGNRPSIVFRRAVVELYHSPLVGGWLRFFPATLKQKVKAWLLGRDEAIPCPALDDNPKVSLVIPVYNHARYLDRCIKSAVGQDYRNLEVIIVDDASTEPGVGAILNKYAGDPKVKLFFNESNSGISDTQNRAIVNSTGEIIAFLDCDDYLSHDAVSSSMRHWKASTVYLHTARSNVDRNDKVVQRISFEHLPRKDYFSENLKAMYATHFKMIRKDAFAKVGLFDPRFNSAQDYDMLMRIAFHYPSESFVFVPNFVYFHRLHGRQDSEVNEERQLKNTEIIQAEAGLRRSISQGVFDKAVSIIMLSYGKHEQTLEAVKSIEDTVRVPFEIILFDNGSDAKTVNFLKSEIDGRHPFVKLIVNRENLGPAEGRRQAIKHAKGPYYIVFDNDEIARPGWIEELLVRAETSPDIAAVVARVYFPDNKLQFSGGAVRYIDEELVELVRFDAGKSRFDPSTALFRDCGWVPIGATLFKVDPSPYLYEGYRNLFEDAGVSFALKKKGYRLVNAPGALVLHNHFMFRDNVSMKNKYLEARYNPEGMLRAVASFYAENNLIIYDEYVWKENGLSRLSRSALKELLSNTAQMALKR